VVYVGAINVGHLSISKAMLNAGKHVICEKPICMSVKDTTELLSLAKKKNLFIMEVNLFTYQI